MRWRKRFSGRGTTVWVCGQRAGFSGLHFRCILRQCCKERRTWTWESDQHGLDSQPLLQLSFRLVVRVIDGEAKLVIWWYVALGEYQGSQIDWVINMNTEVPWMLAEVQEKERLSQMLRPSGALGERMERMVLHDSTCFKGRGSWGKIEQQWFGEDNEEWGRGLFMGWAWRYVLPACPSKAFLLPNPRANPEAYSASHIFPLLLCCRLLGWSIPYFSF